MKRLITLICIFSSTQLTAQTGIGTTTPNASAKLDVSSSTLGFLPPRVTLTAVNTFSPIVGSSSAATGLLVYNLGSVGLQAGYYYWNGSSWATIATASSPDQTVNYVSVGSIYLTGVGGSQDLVFPTNYGGNIPYNTSTGVFTLSANKTYLFQAQVRVNAPSAGGSYIEYGFDDAVSNALLVNGTQTITSSSTSTAGYGSNPVINFIYTPSSNQTVKIRTTSNTVGTQTVVSGTANITQIGSSAIINPWTLSGTNTYNTTGNVGIGASSPTEKLEVNGNVKASSFIGSGSQLTDVATKVTGSWNVPNGTNYFTIGLSPGTYIIWVNGNVPNGIIIYNALVTISNTNVPASGNYSSWVYNGGGTPLDFIFLPDQIVGSNTTVRSSSYSGSNSNNFIFGIRNTTSNNYQVNYGYIKL